MSGSNSRSVIQRRRRKEKAKRRLQKLISQERSQSANALYPAEKFLKLKRVTFARIHRLIENLVNSSSAKLSSGARFRKNRRKSFSPLGKPIFSRALSRSADVLSPLI